MSDTDSLTRAVLILTETLNREIVEKNDWRRRYDELAHELRMGRLLWNGRAPSWWNLGKWWQKRPEP